MEILALLTVRVTLSHALEDVQQERAEVATRMAEGSSEAVSSMGGEFTEARPATLSSSFPP